MNVGVLTDDKNWVLVIGEAAAWYKYTSNDALETVIFEALLCLGVWMLAVLFAESIRYKKVCLYSMWRGINSRFSESEKLENRDTGGKN